MSDKKHGQNQGPDGFEEADAINDGAQAEAWQEDQPPVDDFHDQAENEAASAELDAAEAAAADQTAAPNAKSGTKIVAIIGLVGAALIGGLLYLQFGSSSAPSSASMPIAEAMRMAQNMPAPQPSAEPSSTASLPAAAPPPVGEVAVVDPETSAKTSSADIANLYASGQAKNAIGGGVAMPAARPAEEGGVTMPPSIDGAPKDAPAMPPAIAPLASDQAPKIDATMPPLAAAAPLPPVTALPPTTPSIAAPATPADNTRLNELSANLDALKKTLDQMVQQNTQLAARLDAVAKAPTTAAVAATVEPRLESRLAALEQRLDMMAKTEVPSLKDETQLPAVTTNAMAKPETAKPVATVKTEKKHHHVAKKKAPPAKKAPSKVAAPQPAAPSRAWVLRAATPDAAWIAKDAKASELSKVKIGDTVEGIGQVESITQLGEGWVVVGSKGAIH